MVLQNLQNDFKGSNWKHEIDVRDFIQANYEPYDGDESFLTAPSARTTMLWDKLSEMFKVEREKGVYDAETKLPQTLDTYGAGYIDKDNEVIVGLQTDAPLKRGIFPRGGIRMVESALKAYGYELDPATKDIYTKYCKTHNEGVFSAYNDDIKAARHAHIITGLPDAYGRGRIIGDYRRVALYGVDRLIEDKEEQKNRTDSAMYAEVMRENAYLSRTIEVQENQKLIDTGLYGIVRHPMYTATLLMFLAIPLILGSWWGVAVFAVYPMLIVKRIQNEEQVLAAGLKGYTDYQQRVRWRLIPWVW